MVTLEEATQVYYPRYGAKAQAAAKLSFTLNRADRFKLIYEWVKTGRIDLNTFKLMIEDFI